MSIAAGVLSAIDCVYEAGREPAAWPKAVERIISIVGASGGGMQVHDAKTWRPIHCAQLGLSRESIDDYVDAFMRSNPVVRAASRTALGTPLTDWMAIPKPELLRSPIYQEFGRRNQIHGMANVTLVRNKGMFANFNLLRSKGLGDFERTDVELLGTLGPHLVRAAEMNLLLEKLNRERYAAYAALERMETGVLFVAADGFVVHMNSAAADMIATKDAVVLRHNRLGALLPVPDKELARLVAEAASRTGQQGGTLVVPRTLGGRPLLARAYPLSAHGRFTPPDHATVIVYLTDPELRPSDPASDLARAYRLAPAEQRLLTRLLDSPSLLEAADSLSITEATARTLLGRIFAKTGTNRQVELMRLMLATRQPLRGKGGAD
jgi:DNA-binding CsgD family transcriptional regulator/PAS domain-containing protein